MGATDTGNPYPGLRAFEGDEAELFFGRERETDELRRRLRTSRFLSVIGTSGSGKSSLVRCGLVPSLHSGFMTGVGSSWRVAITHPGENPIGRLADALDSPDVLRTDETYADTRRTPLEVTLHDSSLGLVEAVRQARLPEADSLLVVVDQFEELFRFRRSRSADAATDDAVAFVRLLLEATRQQALPIFVVITMRSEFIGECAAFDGLPEALNAGQYLIPRLGRDAMRAATAGPASVRGASVAPRLLTRLLNEVGDDPDQLPVLQHALMRSWDAWAVDHAEGEPIDNRHYEAIGTMREALSRHADEAYKELETDTDRRIAERLFKTLTEITEGGHRIRRPTTAQRLARVCGTGVVELERVIDHFRATGRAFLRPAAGSRLKAEDIVDISHESFMRMWTRLVGWIGEEARAVEIYRRLSRSAVQHDAGEASLWRPPELSIGLRWLRDLRPTAAWAGDEKEFERAMRFLRRSSLVRKVKVGALVAAGAIAVGLALNGFYQEAETQRRLAAAQLAEADRQREEADRQRKLAEAQRAENARLEAELQRLTPSRVKSELVRWITVSNAEVMPLEVLEVKVSTQSSRVRISGIFKGANGPQRVEGRYDPASGGIHVLYGIPADAAPGPRTASIYVQEIGSSREEVHEISYLVVPRR